MQNIPVWPKFKKSNIIPWKILGRRIQCSYVLLSFFLSSPYLHSTAASVFSIHSTLKLLLYLSQVLPTFSSTISDNYLTPHPTQINSSFHKRRMTELFIKISIWYHHLKTVIHHHCLFVHVAALSKFRAPTFPMKHLHDCFSILSAVMFCVILCNSYCAYLAKMELTTSHS